MCSDPRRGTNVLFSMNFVGHIHIHSHPWLQKIDIKYGHCGALCFVLYSFSMHSTHFPHMDYSSFSFSFQLQTRQ